LKRHRVEPCEINRHMFIARCLTTSRIVLTNGKTKTGTASV